MEKKDGAFRTSIGGQALIEGILMRGPKKQAIVVRSPEGLVTKVEELTLIRDKYPILGWPIIRGAVTFIDSMVRGVKALMYSADYFPEEEVGEPSKLDQWIEAHIPEEKMQKVLVWFSVLLSIGLTLVLFMLLPRLAVQGLRAVFKTEFSPVVRSSIEQLLKLTIFVIYVWAVSFMKDIKRVFMYHGAEHKTIFCYEKGLPLTVENVREQRRFHPRCGTSFMILMILVSIIFSTIVQIIFPSVYNIAWLWVVIKILLIPLVCGAGFEVLKICGKYDNLATKIISAPGLWLQRITTKEPDDGMIEIAIAALKACEPAVPDVDRSVDRAEENDNTETDETEE